MLDVQGHKGGWRGWGKGGAETGEEFKERAGTLEDFARGSQSL